MASLKALKLRITSIKSTQKITKAMKMVAAAKLRRAQEAAEAARPYSERMAAVMASLGSRIVVGPESPKLLTGTGIGRRPTCSSSSPPSAALPAGSIPTSSASRAAAPTS